MARPQGFSEKTRGNNQRLQNLHTMRNITIHWPTVQILVSNICQWMDKSNNMSACLNNQAHSLEVRNRGPPLNFRGPSRIRQKTSLLRL